MSVLSFARIGATWLIALPVSLFVGLMIATAGGAIYPPVTFVATPLVCRGEVDVVSQNYSYRPGQRGVTRTIYCVSGGAKGEREDITFKTIFTTFAVYSVIAFLLLRLIVVPLLRRRFGDAWQSMRGRASPGDDSPVAAADLQTILARVADAVQRGEGRVVVRNMTLDARDGELRSDDDPAERLARLKELRDQGLINAEDYEAKKAEILSRL